MVEHGFGLRVGEKVVWVDGLQVIIIPCFSVHVIVVCIFKLLCIDFSLQERLSGLDCAKIINWLFIKGLIHPHFSALLLTFLRKSDIALILSCTEIEFESFHLTVFAILLH